jgi:DNA repair protein RecN (Recombination protein N)
MLTELAIENLGIIENARLSFEDGFTVFTGETGAGKTMLVEAINLVVGRRAETSVIRDGADEARVEARFVHLVDGEEHETILCRVLSREGRSKAYVNNRMATVATLAELGEALVDIHGQHAHQRLLTAAVQRDSLDSFGGVDVSPLREAREKVTEIDAMLAALGGDEKSRVREIDLLQFQCDEIESTGLSDVDEDERLSQEEDALSDVVRHQEALWKVVALLSNDGAVIDELGIAVQALGALGSIAEISERLGALQADAKDLAHVIRDAAERAEENPERLEEIRLRRQLLRDLMRKYGDTLADVMAFGAEARQRLDELMGYAERVSELEAQKAKALKVLQQRQREVGNQRRAVAPSLAAAIEKRLRTLALPHATLQVSVGDADSDPAGESVVFLLAANPGRGIGGAAAVAVATALRELGDGHQVFAVTHLPQVGASAHHQIVVSKSVKSGKTYGAAIPVADADRAVEIARMLSGGVADESATAHARDLLQSLGESNRRKGRTR